ncbi:hypothetical protein IWW50_004670 [Coemansia erecta]|nr:hypothetical protein GGF43_002327 [Coemansia sp. RSA 2618]KAJ2821355.1 hypothetical protein IWW50_004670 [Coemansia erecta]
MSLDQIRKEIVDSRPSMEPPVGGRYIALLRRTPTGMLFSDPVFVSHNQPLPELPDGVEYIVVHPQTTTAKTSLMEAYMPTGALNKPAQPECAKLRLPIFEDCGMYSSFLPSRDSSGTCLSSADFTTLNSGLVGQPQALEADIDQAMELANKILNGSASSENGSQTSAATDISSETLLNLGLLPADIGLDSGSDTPAEETAESILRENNMLLAQLQQLQDVRARSDNYGQISEEEQQIAKKLQKNLARTIAAHAPSQIRPSQEEIQQAVKLLLGGGSSLATYAGTLPPQRRYAFMSNAVAGSAVPQNATTAPMQQVPKKR